MLFAALDLNANRVRALRGLAGQRPQPIYLDGQEATLPLAISLAERKPQVGHAALALCRRTPHVVCDGFLARLGEDRCWRHGRHRLDPVSAMELVWGRVREAIPGLESLAVVAPGYLTAQQVGILHESLKRAKLPVQAMVNRSLVVGHDWNRAAQHEVGVIVDVDDHALTCAVVRPGDAELCCLGQEVLPTLGLRRWRESLIGRIAELCAQASRRDPRESADTDQQLFEQVERVFDAAGRNQSSVIRLQGGRWQQTVTVTPADTIAACVPAARSAAATVKAALNWADQQLTSVTIYFTAEAARLPGLAAAIYQITENRVPVVNVSATAPALAAFDLVQRIHRGEIAAGLYGAAVPVPDCGPLTPHEARPHAEREVDDPVEPEDWADMLPFPTADIAFAE